MKKIIFAIAIIMPMLISSCVKLHEEENYIIEDSRVIGSWSNDSVYLRLCDNGEYIYHIKGKFIDRGTYTKKDNSISLNSKIHNNKLNIKIIADNNNNKQYHLWDSEININADYLYLNMSFYHKYFNSTLYKDEDYNDILDKDYVVGLYFRDGRRFPFTYSSNYVYFNNEYILSFHKDLYSSFRRDYKYITYNDILCFFEDGIDYDNAYSGDFKIYESKVSFKRYYNDVETLEMIAY